MTIEEIDNKLVEVRKTITFAERLLKRAPKGMLYVRTEKQADRYYLREKGKTSGEYLGVENRNTIKALEEKAYYTKLLKTARQEEEDILKAKEILEGVLDYDSVFLSIPKKKRHLISPYKYEYKKEYDGVVRVFNKKPVRKEIKLITQNGEYVRSKTEVIIADRLKAAGVSYFYEDPLILSEEGNSECIYWHPDFKVQNIRTGKTYYWEHFGMLDNSDYCAECQNRLETYAHYGFFPGENLIISFESSLHGLNVEYVDCLIDKYLK